MSSAASYRSRGGYRSAGSLRPLRPSYLLTAKNEGTPLTKQELRDMLAEAARNTAEQEAKQ
jgi:hypothetical protein